MSANDKQHGGDHYAADYQHWDWAIDINLGYLESAATKYISRWREKNGLIDLRKACHYMEKAAEAFGEGRCQNYSTGNPMVKSFLDQDPITLTKRFAAANSLTALEFDTVLSCVTWHDELTVREAIGNCYRLIDMAKAEGYE